MLLTERYFDLAKDPAPILRLVDTLEGHRELLELGFNGAATASDTIANGSALALGTVHLSQDLAKRICATNAEIFRQFPGGEFIAALNASAAASIDETNLALARMGYSPIPLIENFRRLNSANGNFLRHLASPIERVPLDLDGLTVNGIPIKAEEVYVHSDTFYNITHVKRTKPDGEPLDRIDPKVVLFVPASGHMKSLLEDTIRKLAPGHELYIFEVEDASQIPAALGDFTLDDFVDATMHANKVVTDHDPYNGRVDVQLRANDIAVCQPGPGGLAGTAIMGGNEDYFRPASFSVLASPIDTSIAPTGTNEFALSQSPEWFESSVITSVHAGLPGEGRHVYPRHFQRLAFIFKTVESAQSHGKHLGDLHANLYAGNEAAVAKKQKFDRVFFFDIASLTKGLYLQTVHEFFQRNALANGIFSHRGRLVDLTQIQDTAIIAADGSKDDICGFDASRNRGQTSAILDLTPNVPDEMKAHGVFDAAHYMFAGSAFDKHVGPWLFGQIRHLDDQYNYSPLPKECLSPSAAPTPPETALVAA